MALGLFSDINLVPDATLEGGTWHGTYNLDQLKTEEDYVGSPARCTDPTDLAKTTLTARWAELQTFSFAALLFHTLSIDAKFRLRCSASEAVTNWVLRSHDFGHATWIKDNATVSAAPVATGPDGTTSAWRITFNLPNGTAQVRQDFAIVPAVVQPGTWDVVLKAETVNQVMVRDYANNFNATINLATGVVSGVTAGSTAGVVNLGNGWWRFWVKSTLTVSPGALAIRNDGASTGSILAFSAQASPGSVLGPIVKTLGVAVTQAAGVMDEWQAYDFDSGWLWVYPSLYDPADLLFGVENWFAGTVLPSELDLVRRHRFYGFHEQLAYGLRIDIDDRNNGAGFIDLGGLHVCSGFSPAINFNRGRELAVRQRDVVDQAPSGRRFGERRTPERELSISYDLLQDAELRRFIDSVLRKGAIGQVLFVPDLDDEAGMFREAFPATFGKPPAGRFGWPGLGQTAFTLQETLA